MHIVLNCCRSGCLFRAIAHVAYLRNREAATNENCQRELADVLRAQVGFKYHYQQNFSFA